MAGVTLSGQGEQELQRNQNYDRESAVAVIATQKREKKLNQSSK